MTAPATEPPVPRLSTARIFGLSLLAVTVIPFFAAALKYVFPTSISISVQEAVFILGGIHVPLTAYLFLDPKIRALMRRRPTVLIGGPILIFAASIAAFFLSWKSRQAGEAWPMVYVWLAVLAWNNWHFGKQNIGVYSFFRISQSTPGVSPFERRLIVGGAVLGTLAVLNAAEGGAVSAYIRLYAKNETFDGLTWLASWVHPLAMVLQYGLLAVVVGYLAWHWRRFTFGTATVLLLSVNFFFPLYFGIDQALAADARHAVL